MKQSFDFALTTYCQAKCRSCARTNPDTGEKADWLELRHMDLNVFRTTLEATKMDIHGVQFCGEFGDPMMHPDIEKFIDVGLEYAENVQINTNGGLRSADWYQRMAKKHPRTLYIKWGIDGTDAETNSKYREGVDWNRAMSNMRSWFGAGGQGSWHFLVFDWNWHQIPTVRQIADELGCQLNIKVNNRSWGKITPENLVKARELLGVAQ